MTRSEGLQGKYSKSKNKNNHLDEHKENERIFKKANSNQLALGGKRYFTVFRVGEKMKNNPYTDIITIDGLKKFQFHNNRQGKIPNVDNERKHLNKILIGTTEVEKDVLAYLEGVKIRDNSVVAREIILSAGNGFWDRMTPQAQQLWVDTNVKFLKDEFGDNCVYAILHMDETTPHFHALIVPVFYDEEKKIAKLNNSHYFDGKEKLAAWQDKYTEAMTKEFGNYFIRGIRGSKATHVDLKTYYALIKENLNSLNSDSVLAYAKENYINRKKLKNFNPLWIVKKKYSNWLKKLSRITRN